MEREQKLQALANYLEVDTNYFEEEGYDPNEFESKEYNESYVVLTEEEAREYAKRDIESVFDDLGLDAFTPSFQEWILNNAVEGDFFEDAIRESNQFYIDDIENEYDEVFENRLISELVENDILTEDDFENWGEENPTVKDDVDLDDKKREYLEHLVSGISDYAEEYKNQFGEDDFNDVVKEGKVDIDMEAVVDECISMDGIAHFVARYDGNEHDLGNGLYAYRVN